MSDENRTRRKFIKTTGAAAIGSTLISGFGIPSMAFGRNNDTLKVGLIGCGGRGTGAANQALTADDNVVLWAMGDIFDDRISESHANLQKLHPDTVKVDNDRKFVGVDSYKKVLESGVDVVILTTPPYFRPVQFEAAINAGKHVFSEKPMAVDAPGVRKVLEASRKAKEKQLSVVSGFCWRFHTPKRETFQRVLDGAIGDVMSVYNTYNTGGLWLRDVKPDWTPMRKKIKNWIYHNWISGDPIMEQFIHSIDMMSWALDDIKPLNATGTGGRQSRIEPEYGNVFDHYAIVYEYENGAKGFHFGRQQKNCSNSYGLDMLGTEGRCVVDCPKNKHVITGKENWKYRGSGNDMYQQEHDELFASIRAGKPINNGEWMAQSTMLALMGRMVAYTGKTITYEEAFNSQEVLGPEVLDLDTDYQDAPVARPGITPFR